MTVIDGILIATVFLSAGIVVTISRLNRLLESLQAIAQQQQADREHRRKLDRRTRQRERDQQERELRLNKCPLCEGKRSYYRLSCVYCLGYGEARRSEDADRRFAEWSGEVRQQWMTHFGMPFAPSAESDVAAAPRPHTRG
jgi:hypothetical protein